MPTRDELLKQRPPACSCDRCRSCCQRPGWGTPAEIKAIIDAGLGDRLMLDYWIDSKRDVEILAPATKGYEADGAPFWPRGEYCTFYNAEGLCDLHARGLKPIECVMAHHAQRAPINLHEWCRDQWDTDEGRALVAAWKADHGW